ncbi:hypothetical protein H4582DRAFT_1365986 [Lactarius indigo]|nr:hypothetical protein H4582DRAFT_1365986 [Lactarius indigo]
MSGVLVHTMRSRLSMSTEAQRITCLGSRVLALERSDVSPQSLSLIVASLRCLSGSVWVKRSAVVDHTPSSVLTATAIISQPPSKFPISLVDVTIPFLAHNVPCTCWIAPNRKPPSDDRDLLARSTHSHARTHDRTLYLTYFPPTRCQPLFAEPAPGDSEVSLRTASPVEVSF